MKFKGKWIIPRTHGIKKLPFEIYLDAVLALFSGTGPILVLLYGGLFIVFPNFVLLPHTILNADSKSVVTIYHVISFAYIFFGISAVALLTVQHVTLSFPFLSESILLIF